MSFEWLFQWWNAVYSVPLAFVLVFLTITSLVSLVGGTLGELTHGDADVDHDVDVGHDVAHDVDVGHDIDTDVDVHADVDAEADVHGNGHAHPAGAHHADPGPILSGLMFIGVGKAPMVLVLQVFLLLWGLTGLILHQLANVIGPGALLWSLPITLLVSVLGTRSFALVFARCFKPYETASVRRDQIVGRTGHVVFPVTEEEGTVHVRDQHGTLHRLRARSGQGRFESGQEIIITGYNAQDRIYQVDDATAFVDRA